MCFFCLGVTSTYLPKVNARTHTNASHTQVFADIVQVTRLVKEPWGRLSPAAGTDAPDASTFSLRATTESQNAKVCARRDIVSCL